MNVVDRPDTSAFRYGYFALCLICIGLGYVGAVTPVMPSTVFFIVALWAAKKSSPELEDWLRTNPICGKALQDWDQHRVISPRAKFIAVSVLWLSLVISAMFVKSPWAQAGLGLTGLLVSLFLLTRKSHPTP